MLLQVTVLGELYKQTRGSLLFAAVQDRMIRFAIVSEDPTYSGLHAHTAPNLVVTRITTRLSYFTVSISHIFLCQLCQINVSEFLAQYWILGSIRIKTVLTAL